MTTRAFENRFTDPTGMTVRDKDGKLVIDGKKVRRDDVQVKEPVKKKKRN